MTPFAKSPINKPLDRRCSGQHMIEGERIVNPS